LLAQRGSAFYLRKKNFLKKKKCEKRKKVQAKILENKKFKLEV
jgi:hypothetical protein